MSTPKFTLRAFRKSDVDAIVKHANDKTIADNTIPIPYPYTRKDAMYWVNKGSKKTKTSLNLAIDIDGEAVGCIGLHGITAHKAEIGYWLGRNHWGKGIMTAAVKRMTVLAFSTFKLRRIYAPVFSFNAASARVLEKAGYQYEGTLRKAVIKNGKPIDERLYAKVR